MSDTNIDVGWDDAGIVNLTIVVDGRKMVHRLVPGEAKQIAAMLNQAADIVRSGTGPSRIVLPERIVR